MTSRTSPAFRMVCQEDRFFYLAGAGADYLPQLSQQQRTRAKNLSEESEYLASLKQEYNGMFRRRQASSLVPQQHDDDDDDENGVPDDSSLYDPNASDNRRGHTCCGSYCFHARRMTRPSRSILRSVHCFDASVKHRDAFQDEHDDNSDCVYCSNCKRCKQEQVRTIEKRYQAKHLVEEMLEKVQGCDDLSNILRVWLSENQRQLPPSSHFIAEGALCLPVSQGLPMPRTTKIKPKKSHRGRRPSALDRLSCWQKEDAGNSALASAPAVIVHAEPVHEECESQGSRRAKDQEEARRLKKLDHLKREAEAAQRELALLRSEHEKMKREKKKQELLLLEHRKMKHSPRQDQQAQVRHKNLQDKRNAKMKASWNAKGHKHSYDFAPLLHGSDILESECQGLPRSPTCMDTLFPSRNGRREYGI